MQLGKDGGGVFQTYRIESINHNKIGFEIDVAQFLRALKVRLCLFSCRALR